MSQAIVLRKVAGQFAACYRGFGMKITAAADNTLSLASLAFGLALLLVPVVAVIALIALVFHPTVHLAGQSLAMSLVTAKSLREQRANLATQAQAILDKAQAESRALTTEETTSFDRFHDEMEQIRGQYERIERQETINAELAESRGRQAGGREQPGAGAEGAENRSAAPRRETASRPLTTGAEQLRSDALRAWLFRGSDTAPSEELRNAASQIGVDVNNKILQFDLAQRPLRRLDRESVRDWEERTMSTTTGSQGGYTVPDDTMRSLETAMLQFGGMRQVADVLRTDSGADLPWPTLDDTDQEGEIIGQNTVTNRQDLAFSQMVLKAFKYSSKHILIPVELLQDSAVNLPEVVGGALGTRIGRVANKHFTIGAGTTEPWGIVTRSVLGVTGAGGQTTSVITDDLVDLEHSVDPAYRTNAKWMFADSTLKALKKLKSSSTDLPLWLPGIAVREPDTILGYPYVINQAVPVMAANAKSIIFGDLSKYKIRDVRQVTLLRLDERFAEYHQVAFLAFSRHDGDLLNAGTDPVKHYKNAAA